MRVIHGHFENVDIDGAGERAFDLNYWKRELKQECEIMEKELKALLVRKHIVTIGLTVGGWWPATTIQRNACRINIRFVPNTASEVLHVLTVFTGY